MGIDMDDDEVSENLFLLIKSKREFLKLSISDVSDKLKISVENVESFENEQTDFSSFTPFQRGYFRNYLALLGLPEKLFSDAFKGVKKVRSEIYSLDENVSKQPIINRTKINIILLIVVLITVILFSL